MTRYVTKTVKYAAAGVRHYWIVDPEERTVAVLTLDGDHYRLDSTVTGEERVDVDFGAGHALIDMNALLP